MIFQTRLYGCHFQLNELVPPKTFTSPVLLIFYVNIYRLSRPTIPPWLIDAHLCWVHSWACFIQACTTQWTYTSVPLGISTKSYRYTGQCVWSYIDRNYSNRLNMCNWLQNLSNTKYWEVLSSEGLALPRDIVDMGMASTLGLGGLSKSKTYPPMLLTNTINDRVHLNMSTLLSFSGIFWKYLHCRN